QGTIHLNGVDITNLPDWRRAQEGIGRSFQRTNLFPAMTVLENARLAAQSTVRGRRLLGGARDDANTLRLASEALDRVGLGACATSLAGTLSHGQLRLLEIALVLATRPTALLLDEP